jgi:hypothetical protein
MSFNIIETTIEQVHVAYRSGELTCRQLVQNAGSDRGKLDESRSRSPLETWRAETGRGSLCRLLLSKCKRLISRIP